MTLTLHDDLDLASCLPDLPGMDWSLLREGDFAFVGTGAVNRPLARQLAWLGMQRCLLIDPKRYKPQSIISQCNPNEVGEYKAAMLAKELNIMNVETTALIKDVDVVPPGYLEPNTLVVVAVDNRRADICANRFAARMRCPIVKVHVEPSYLTASIRCYHLKDNPVSVCMECQMTDRHYEQQLHPLSCDGGEEQTTGSPRALSQLAANAAALAISQIVCSPQEWAKQWWGKQWQQNLLGGQGSFLELDPNPNCRWEHSRVWTSLVRLPDWKEMSLAQLAALAKLKTKQIESVEFSGRVATQTVCSKCHRQKDSLRWVAELDQPTANCDCGGEAYAVPFFTHKRLPLGELLESWNQPLVEWGVTAGAVIQLNARTKQQAFSLSVDVCRV